MMGDALFQVVAFTLPAVVVAAIAAAWAAWRPLSASTTSVIQHLAAGILFAAAALELLPQARTEARLPVTIGFALGLALMLAMRQLSDGGPLRQAEEGGVPWRLLGVSAVDLAIDGLVLGVAFAAGEHAGILLAIALTLEVFFLGLSVAAELASARLPRWHTLAVPPLLALILMGFAVLGRWLFGGLAPFPFAILLGVGLVAVLYLVVEELLVEAHEVKETPWSIGAFFAGFLLFLVIEMSI